MALIHLQTLIIVEGEGTFPFDMLRFDMCAPFTTVDVIRMLDANTRRQVTLRRFSVRAEPATSHKWREHGWTVIQDSGHK